MNAFLVEGNTCRVATADDIVAAGPTPATVMSTSDVEHTSPAAPFFDSAINDLNQLQIDDLLGGQEHLRDGYRHQA